MACKPAPPEPAQPAPAGPTVRATVVTIRTTIRPSKRTFGHTLVIAGDRARSTNERDVWRLYDFRAKTVTFVDDVERTFRTESIESIVKKRRAATSETLPPHYPVAEFRRGDATRTILGVTAKEAVIESGDYKRRLWVAEHPSIPPSLFATMHASETVSSPLAPMMRAVDEALIDLSGFPLLDQAELPYGKEKLVIERAVVNITQRDVPEASLMVPKGYRDVSTSPLPTRREEGR